MSYQPIGNYGIAGDLNTIALVGLNGSIDFLHFPRFDSPSVFAALPDDKKGGVCSISPEFKEMKTKQLYFPDTDVLLTRFLSSEGVGAVTDFMRVDPNGENTLIHRVTTVRGEVKYQLRCCPRFKYAKNTHAVVRINDQEVIFRSEGPNGFALSLRGNVPLQVDNADVVAGFTLKAGEMTDFLLECEANPEVTGGFCRLRDGASSADDQLLEGMGRPFNLQGPLAGSRQCRGRHFWASGKYRRRMNGLGSCIRLMVTGSYRNPRRIILKASIRVIFRRHSRMWR